MAYTAVVTKESVSKISDKIYQCSIKVVVNDGASDVFEATASEQYNTNSTNLTDVKNRLIAKIKEQWDKYADEHDIFSAAAFDTMVGEIQTAANVYINQ